jgi:hypothetical protein
VTALRELERLLDGLERASSSVMALARGGRPQEPWTLYPDEYGVFDRKRHSQFYYHAHAGAGHEAGHFHTVRLFRDHTVHLVAISMSDTGWPRALFTLNLWSIGDVYASPEDLARYARQYRVESRKADARLVRFVNLMFRAFLPEIEALQVEKERAIQRYRAVHGGADPFEDRAVEILSQVEVDVRAYLGTSHEEALR